MNEHPGLQEIFDTVASHLLAQGVKSKLKDFGPAYRDGHGHFCAIGCLIPDELYTPEIEGKTIHAFEIAREGPCYKIGKHLDLDDKWKYQLLRKLQIIHDNYEPDEWRHELKMVAWGYQLEWRNA